MEEHLRNLFSRFHDHFAIGPGLGSTAGQISTVDSLPPSFIKPLFSAAAALYRTQPWSRLRPTHLFSIRVSKDSDWPNSPQLFPCAQFTGADGGDLGFLLFKSDTDAIRSIGANETIRIPNTEMFRVVYVQEILLSSTNRRMVRSLSLEACGDDNWFPVFDVVRINSAGAVRFRNPSVEELKYVFAFMKAVVLVHPLLRVVVDEDGVAKNKKRGRLVSYEPLVETVDVQWPAEMSKGNWDFVAVTLSHPPGQMYEEKRRNSSPMKFSDVLQKHEVSLSSIEKNAKFDAVRQCTMCEKEVLDEHSICCGQCLAVVYCGPVCQKQHWKETHKNMCGLYKVMMGRADELIMKVFNFPCFVDHPCKWLELLGLHKKGMWRRLCECYSDYPFGLLPSSNKTGSVVDSWGVLCDSEYPFDCPLGRYMDGNSNLILLSGWSEYYNVCRLPMSSPVAVILSHPLTLYYILTALYTSTKNRLLKGKDVVVHYLGPELELDWMTAFAEIGHMLNSLGNIQIVMIGPEIPSNLSGTTSGMGSRMKVNLVRGTYQEKSAYLSTPHVVVAMNCALANYGSWNGALELIKSMNVPAFFTEISEILCTNAKQVLRGAGLHITHPVTPNPFRSPVQDQEPSTNLPTFSNGFVFGVNT